MVDPAQDTGRVAISKFGSKSSLRAYVLLAITAGGLIVCGLLVLPFLPAVTWAVALAILFAPAHQMVERNLKSANIAALMSVLWIGLLIVLPITFLARRLVAEVPKGVEAIKATAASEEWRRMLDNYPFLATLADWSEQWDLPGAIGSLASWVASASGSLVRGGILQLIILLLTFYFLFYFLRDRKMILDWLREISPLSRAEMDQLFARINDTVRATLYGTVVVASIQGTLGGLIFWWLGLPMPLLWGIAMGLFSIVPILGAFVVWIPAAIFLAIAGHWGNALILTAWGAVAIGGIDNLLYPLLVGNRLKLHTVPAFLSIVGGLILFGAAGLILGPLTIALTVFLLELWRVHVRSHTPAA
jgi:predicted PurR-regulated permease PerM